MKKLLLTFLGVALLAFVSFAQKSEIFSTEKGAIDGYDAVAYFTEKKPVAGQTAFSYEWKGEKWLFASKKNLDAFAAAPEKYAPQYGGYCAFGMAGGYKAKVDPLAWSVVNDKLYLNYNLDVQKDWIKKQKELIEKADKNWPTVKTK